MSRPRHQPPSDAPSVSLNGGTHMLSHYYEPWTAYAVCREVGSDAFYPEIGEDWQEPVKVCLSSCPVRLLCLDSVMRYEQGRNRSQRFSVAGGLTPGKRAKYEPEWLAEQTEAAA